MQSSGFRGGFRGGSNSVQRENSSRQEKSSQGDNLRRSNKSFL